MSQDIVFEIVGDVGPIGPQGPQGVTELMNRLMGKGEAAARRELMERHGDAIEVDI